MTAHQLTPGVEIRSDTGDYLATITTTEYAISAADWAWYLDAADRAGILDRGDDPAVVDLGLSVLVELALEDPDRADRVRLAMGFSGLTAAGLAAELDDPDGRRWRLTDEFLAVEHPSLPVTWRPEG